MWLFFFFFFCKGVRSTQVEQMPTAWMVDRMMHMGMELWLLPWNS